MGMTQNIPRDTDTALAIIYKRRADANHIIERALDEAHRIVGDQRYDQSAWRRSDTDVEIDVRKLADTHVPTPWTVYDPTSVVARLDTARAELDRCGTDQRPLDDRYNASPWSRFFLVTSSDGHIHSSMSCSTCRVTTEFGWLPELSGQTEADAVAAHGPLLCTVCFPSTRSGWTAGQRKIQYCEGIPDPESSCRRVGTHTYLRCTCGHTAIVNANGSLRKHKPMA
jgi:hypothetical protein